MARRASLANELSRFVVEALVQIGLTERDVLGGAIVHTNLPWQVPPLLIESTLFGVALSEYLERPLHVNTEQLINLFSDVLADMRNAPRKVLTAEGYRGMHLALPQVKFNERHLHFSLPDGFPGAVGDYAGAAFALECAHILRTNVRVSDFISDDDNYYAVLPDGIEIGVRDGLPTMSYDNWDLPVTGMVQEMLMQPRGTLWEGCDYNVISQVRSVCTVHASVLRDFDALDWALQALRVIDGERELLKAVRNIKLVAYERDARVSALRDAHRIAHAMAMSDRQRIEALKGLLVPDILTPPQFSKQIYSYYSPVPPIVAAKVLVRLQNSVAELLEHEEMLFARIKV